MFKKTIFIAGIVLLFFSQNVYSFEEIKGGFGIELGNNIEQYRELVKSNEGIKYVIKPTKPFILFNEYTVYVTPITRLIFKIKGSVKITGDEHNTKKIKDVVGLIKSEIMKYGEPCDDESRLLGTAILNDFNKNNTYIFSNKHRYVKLYESFIEKEYVNDSIILSYIDIDLLEQEFKERGQLEKVGEEVKENKFDEIDKSGL